MAMNLGWNVKSLGSYEVVARVADAERRFPFHVVSSGKGATG
jgi:hypothetical protein